MPIYQYKCTSCDLEFEKIVSLKDREKKQECVSCGSESEKEGLQSFSVKTPLDLKKKDAYTDKEIDMVVGRDADIKRKQFEDKLQKKLANAEKIVDIPVKPGEKFDPDKIIGDANRKAKAAQVVESEKTERNKKLEKGENPDQWDKTGFNKLSV